MRNPVAYEGDKVDKKSADKDKYQKHKVSKNELIRELQREAQDLPEEVYMGGQKKTKTGAYMDAIEKQEMENFKRSNLTTKQLSKLKSKRHEEMQDKIETLDDDNQAIETILNRVNASSFKGGNEYDAKGSGNGAPSSSKFAKSLKKM